MPNYMFRFQYTPEAWAALVKNPEDRTETVRLAVESVGGKLIDLKYTIGGGYTGFVIAELPDAKSLGAMGALTAATGAIAPTGDVAELLSAKEMVEALHKAKTVQYRAPGR